jgi:uncharacterized protein
MTGRHSGQVRSWREGTVRGIGTLGIGAFGGALFWYLQIPLSWLLGALVAVGLLHALSLPLDLPASWRRWTMVAIGTMLGSGFGPDSASGFVAWAPSIGIMLTLTAVCTLATFVAIRRWSDLDETSAFLAALPGGLAVATALSEESGGDTGRVALYHTTRLLLVLGLAPVAIRAGLGSDAFDESFALVSRQADARSWLLLAALGVAGYVAASLWRFPGALLLIPMLLSAVVHASGFVETALPGAAVIAAQIVIGSNIGLRLRQSLALKARTDAWLAIAIGVSLTLAALGVAALASAWLAEPALPLMLSYLPGGAPEMGVVALAMDADPAMVAAHHALRVSALLVLVPFVLLALRADKARWWR